MSTIRSLAALAWAQRGTLSGFCGFVRRPPAHDLDTHDRECGSGPPFCASFHRCLQHHMDAVCLERKTIHPSAGTIRAPFSHYHAFSSLPLSRRNNTSHADCGRHVSRHKTPSQSPTVLEAAWHTSPAPLPSYNRCSRLVQTSSLPEPIRSEASTARDFALDVLDLGHSASEDALYDALRGSKGKITWLVAPSYLVPHAAERDRLLVNESSFGTHVDLQYLRELAQASWQDTGVGIWSFGQNVAL